MMKKIKEITVIADNFTIIFCKEHFGERINWYKECKIRDQMRYDMRYDKGILPFNCKKFDKEFEDQLYREKDLFETVKYDWWNNQPHLYSFEVWYEYKLNVEYIYDSQSYKTQVKLQRERPLGDSKLAITFRDDQPCEILDVFEYQELRESILGNLICRIRKFLYWN